MGRAEWMISSKLKRANRNAALMLFDFWSVVRPKFFLQQTKYKRRFSSLSSRYLLSNWVVVYRIKEVKNIRSRCVAVLLDWTREFDWMCFESNYPPFIYSCDGPTTTTTAHSDTFSYTHTESSKHESPTRNVYIQVGTSLKAIECYFNATCEKVYTSKLF
jgi:hypothetical protein